MNSNPLCAASSYFRIYKCVIELPSARMTSNNIHRVTCGAHASSPLSSPSTTQPGSNIRPPRPAPTQPHLMRIAPIAPPKQAYVTLRSRYERTFTNWWLWEILAVLLSLGTFSALVTVLIVYDGRAVSALPKRISLNAIVSILGTISRTSLMFSVTATLCQLKWLWFSGRTRPLKDLQLYDDASRGPLDSSALLVAKKGRLVRSCIRKMHLLISRKLLGINRRPDYCPSPCT